MTRDYLYPEEFDQNNPTPELMALWEEAMVELRKRRTSNLAWQIPLFCAVLVVTFYLFGVFALIILFILGVLDQMLSTHFEYNVSDDRRTARMTFSYKHEIKNLFLNLPCAVLSKAKEGFGGLIIATIGIITMPFWWPLASALLAVDYLNNIFWLKSYYTWRDHLLDTMKRNGGQTHVRGTHIAPSVQLSGKEPTDGPPPLPPRALEVLGGLLTLQPDGGIVVAGGVEFDRNSTFSNFSANGLTLTRDSVELLQASRDGSDISFRFDGGSWREV